MVHPARRCSDSRLAGFFVIPPVSWRRLRLGLAVREEETSLRMQTYTVALRSMRSRVRNTVRDVPMGLCRKALAHPAGEPRPFPCPAQARGTHRRPRHGTKSPRCRVTPQ